MAAPKQIQDYTALLLLVSIGLALVTILSVWKMNQFKYRLIHETGGAMFYGVLLGLAVRCLPFDWGQHAVNIGETVCACGGLNSTPHILTVNITPRLHYYRHVGKVNQSCPPVSGPLETFDPEVLFNLFLPTIIFHGAYTLNQKRFIENFGSVLTFAFMGTIISCVTIGACIYGFTRLTVLLGQAADGEFFLTDCLLFGAIISATDPVSVIGLLSELRMDLDLHTLLFGESVLNDAVAIVLTHAITTYSQMESGHSFDTPAFFLSVGYFLGVLAGSFLLGFIFTVITALLTKFTRLGENPLLETVVFFLLSWSSFLSAEATGLSGIVAVLFCGMSQARYTVHNLSSEGRTRTKQLSIFISRACNIYPLSFLLNLGRTTKIPRTFQHFMMFAGMRGAVAFSLAARDTSTEVRRTIFTTTLLVIGFTIWVLGTAADPMLRCLNIRAGLDADENPEDLSLEVATGRPDTTGGLWHHLDYKYLKPLLTHCGPPLSDSLPRCCGVFARLFGSPHVQEVEEQLCEIEPDDSARDAEKTENQPLSTGGDSGSEHQEDLLEGDLGLGTAAALAREA
ncbi:sodium/hydrogen exchanger 9-like isoform X2 [Acanthopagrus latus]|uniref:sodium/hydrogen exchanger 9-like isoform X2 n=1 Tax=Acanthopagrus latus TaxID=8177 RepID=UPI00187CB547|nr:sodium/hydrogen exchanger 9-like isoform X2 [Acanthopagrus latus]